MSDYALKNYINRNSIRRLGEQIQQVHSKFPLDRFVKTSSKNLAALEFTQRTNQIAAVLHEMLPAEIPRALKIITKCLPNALPYSDGMFSDNYWLWPLSDYVRDYAADHWQPAIDTCYQLTQCFTSEFAIRPQLQRHPEKTLEVLLEWTRDPSEHVRRLCSEGTRPRLPWASRLSLPRDQVLPILAELRSDPSRYVQKSVANHLNDLGKEDPSWLMATMKKWSRSADDSTQWIIRHALRTQIKQGDSKALAILGYKPAQLKQAKLSVEPKSLKIGNSLIASLQLAGSSRGTQRILIDWVMHYARPSGQSYRKVFKGKEIELRPGEPLEWEKSFPMQPRNTRTLYPGQHRLEVQVNGQVVCQGTFRVTA